jgi:hypothetical protein
MTDKQQKVDKASTALAGTSAEGKVKPDHGRSLSIATSLPSPASRPPDLSPQLLELLAASFAASQSATLSAQATANNNILNSTTTPSNYQIIDALHQRQTSAAAQIASPFNNDYNNLHQQRNNMRAALANNEILRIHNVLASRPPLQQQQQPAHARSSFLPPQHIPIMTHHAAAVAVPNTTIDASTPMQLNEVLLRALLQRIRPDSLQELLLLNHQANPNATMAAAVSTPAGLLNEALLSTLLQQIGPVGTSRQSPTALQILPSQVNNQARNVTAQYLPQPLAAASTPASFGTNLIGLLYTAPPARPSQPDQESDVDRKPAPTTISGLAPKKRAGNSESSTPDEPNARNVAPKKKILELTNRPPIALALDSDEDNLARYQCLARKQIELFETTDNDLAGKAQGRNTPIIVGQVGIRCRHCASFPRQLRSGGSVSYSQTLSGIYQVSQNMFKTHLLGRCFNIPEKVKKDLLALKDRTCRDRGLWGGKLYWRESVQALGVIEDEHVLRFTPDNSASKT